MPNGITIREAILIAIEGLKGRPDDWATKGDKELLRTHVLNYVHDYTKRRGVILEDKDIEDELQTVLDELKAIAVARAPTPTKRK